MTSPSPESAIDPGEHLGLAGNAARHFRWAIGANISFDDLVQAASEGLLVAAEKFDPSRGCKFSTYALPWARHYCRRLVQDHLATVRVPVNQQEKARKAGKSFPIRVWSGDRELGDREAPGQHVTFFDQMPDVSCSEDGQGFDVVNGEQRLVLARALMLELSERERHVIRGRFWADPPRTLADIGKDIGVTRERARQIQNAAIRKLRGLAKE